MKFTPHEYQLEGIKWLVSRAGAGLFLPMGAGKTVMTIAAIDILKRRKFVKKTLIIAPIRACATVWPAEVAKWDEYAYLRVVNLRDGMHLLTSDADIFLINPEQAVKVLTPERLRGFDLLVIDESSLWKAHNSQRFKALKKVLHKFGRRWVLTGTPTPHSLMDLWSQAYIMDGGHALGAYITHFRNAFCMPAGYGGYQWTLVPGAAGMIYERLAPLALRIDALKHLDMPALVHNRIAIKLPQHAQQVYYELERDYMTVIENERIDSPTAAILSLKLRQLVNGGLYTESGDTAHVHTAKVEALEELLSVLDGKPLLVFYEFKHDIERIRAALGADIPNLSGHKHPEQLVAEFNEGKIPVMLAHSQSAGYALNLQKACSDVCWFGLPWSLANYDQANARVWRQGQQSDRVTIHHITAEGTIEDRVHQVLANKARTQKDLLNAIAKLNQDHHNPVPQDSLT
jgi:SNF2 family DNA or RNA helicase